MRFVHILGWLIRQVVIEMGEEQEVCTIERLDEIIARFRVVKLLDKIMPSDYNDLVEAVKCIRDLIAVMVVPPPEVLAENVLTADGTVQVLVEAEGLGLYYGLVSLDKMEMADKVVIETFCRVIEGGEWRRYARMEYAGEQENPLLVWIPVFSHYGFKVTLQQIAGVLKTFEYGFYRRL